MVIIPWLLGWFLPPEELKAVSRPISSLSLASQGSGSSYLPFSGAWVP